MAGGAVREPGERRGPAGPAGGGGAGRPGPLGGEPGLPGPQPAVVVLTIAGVGLGLKLKSSRKFQGSNDQGVHEGIMGWVQDWITLLKLASRRFRSSLDYYQFQIYQGTLVVRFLQEQGVNLNQRVLDLGCGEGGYSYALHIAGAEVVSLDLFPPAVPLAPFVCGNALFLPFANESFPFVFCASLIEHVPHPHLLLQEIKRVLCPDGLAYISFPPFYSPVGGHQFKPYHLLGEKWAIRLTGYKYKGFAMCFGDWGLYPLTIRKVHQILKEIGFQIIDISTRFLPFNVACIPIIGEFLTWHVQFLVRKSQ